MPRSPVKVVTLVLASVVITSAALAHTGATGIVKKRMDAMLDIGKGMKVLAAMIKREAPFDARRARSIGEMIAGHAAMMPKLFPKGSNKKPSEAAPAIWTDWDGFKMIAAEMARDAKVLADPDNPLKSSGDLKAPLVALGKSCKSCHRQFRIPK